MKNKKFNYKVNLVPLNITNAEQTIFRDKLNAIKYLLYEVESLSSGEKIVINKPGGKRNFGRLSRNDFMVFIYTPSEESLWLISHEEIMEDLKAKYACDAEATIQIIKYLHMVCKGQEPNEVLKECKDISIKGLSVELLLKAYKWIWGQEDCNYPKGKGRWLSMRDILNEFNINDEMTSD
jgi:hypothetical protein